MTERRHAAQPRGDASPPAEAVPETPAGFDPLDGFADELARLRAGEGAAAPWMAYDAAVAALICERIAEGASLRRICAVAGAPSATLVRRWLAETPEFRRRYARAREDQADTLADEILDEARGVRPDNAQAKRLLLDALKWRAGRLKPKLYGDRVDIGSAEDMDPDSLTDAQLLAIATGRRGDAAGPERDTTQP
ncbi:protein of unknown function [Rhodovastum atsumiense]|uniref:terminase small subunit-like protein n=1 Tax=Rhodovastum atsumiense TaxID=504468 RepID=UPI00193B5FA2|nr:hypothetical protein [Rhodovastum atsumiense]CAH2603195.1 protein of unknown function [Rhodovastum atsumiense]